MFQAHVIIRSRVHKAIHRPHSSCRSVAARLCEWLIGSLARYDFVAEVPGAEDAVQQHFEVVAGGGVAVEVEAAAGLEDAVELDEAGGHHDEVGGHLVAAEEARPVEISDEGGNQVDKTLVGAGDEVGVEVFGAAAPVPAVLERR